MYLVVFAPRILVPAQDQQITVSTLYQLEIFTLIQECKATGFPEPSIAWTSNGSFFQSESILTLQFEDLRRGIYMIFTCTASNYVGFSSKSIEIVTSILVFPVSKLIVDNKGNNYIEVQWLGDSQYKEYDLSYLICLRKSDDSGGECIQAVLSTDTSYLFENLEDSTPYNITIVTITLFGRSPESEALVVETDPVVTVCELWNYLIHKL